jgi:uncharacterized membrane protein
MESAPPNNSAASAPPGSRGRTRLLSPAGPDPSGFFRARTAVIALAALVLLYVALFSAFSGYSFLNFGFSAYDAGMHDQAVWKLATGRGLFNTVRGLNVWGDHCWFIMLLMAPLYWVAPHLGTLLVLQSAALAAGAVPLAVLAHRKTGNRWAAVMLAAAWLLSPALQNMNLENFHPEVVAAPFLLWAIERADVKRWTGYWIAFGIALICKEDMALTLFMLSLWVCLRRDRRQGAAGMLLCVVWFIFCMKVVLPALNDQGFFRFSGGYWFSGFWARKFDPAFYRECFTTPQALQYFLRLGAPVLFLALLSPLLAAIALPSLFVNLVSRNPYLVSIDFHYTYQALPALFAATACGIGWVGARLPWGRLAVWLMAAGVLAASWQANARWGHLPARRALSEVQRHRHFHETSGAAQRFRRMAARLPADPDVPIAASHNLVASLTHRNEIYMFANPWKAEYWGIAGEGLEGRAARVQALFIDRCAIEGPGAEILKALLATGEFKIVAEEGTLLVALRQPRPPLDCAAGDPLQLPPPGRGIRVLAYRSPVPLKELTPLAGVPPTVEAVTLCLRLPLTYERLRTAEGMELGGKHHMRVVLCGSWTARGQAETLLRVNSDDGCRLYVDGVAVAALNGIRAMGAPAQTAPLRLAPGPHTIVVDYFQAGGDAGLTVEFAGPEMRFAPLVWNTPLP